MEKNKTTTLYDHYKNTPEKLKIVCDWDEVIQSAYPYSHYLGMLERNREAEGFGIKYDQRDFPDYFNIYWRVGRSGHQLKNPPDIYHQMPFLTIAEDLLKLIKEGKIEELIFLSTSDDRKWEVFKETFLNLKEIDKVCLKMMTDFPQYQTKAEWIKDNAPDFGIFIDDDPKNCREVIEMREEDNADWDRHGDECMGCSDCWDPEVLFENMKVFAPYYPALAEKHDKAVILVKQEVSNLTKEDFNK